MKNKGDILVLGKETNPGVFMILLGFCILLVALC